MTALFSQRLLAWFDQHGRHDLPWQTPRTPYRVWLAEIMLQQTQVAAVIPYFQRFVARFPDVRSLAAAPADDVLQHWAGLGYYARARNLQRAAQLVVSEHGGEFPRELEAMTALPGVGRSTAAAVLAQAYGQRHAILDGNVKRVLARHGAIEGWPGEPKVTKHLWALSESLLPQERLVDYTQAIMDLGATLCTARNPACGRCPVSADCKAHLKGTVARFPAPRPKRERPLRHARLLLVENAQGELLFERRPPAGIWGGLWCLPVLEGEEDAAEWLAREHGLSARVAQTLAPISHGFTHFELELSPVRLRAAAGSTSLREQAPLRWINIAADALPGLPAPVAKLLARLNAPPGPQQALALEPIPQTRRRTPRKTAAPL
ncbi:MAG TPA: A/G-specific adenine glycosylase, partial [Nevskia sp.]|nr:A/G-specific adenine glycosylase [Nevskia sp.]